jgi:hypothetical protein
MSSFRLASESRSGMTASKRRITQAKPKSPSSSAPPATSNIGFDSWRQRTFVRLPLHRPNGANGMSDMAGKAARVAVERSGSCRDTMERMG